MAFLDELKKITRPYDEDEDFYEEDGAQEEFSDISEQISEDAQDSDDRGEAKESSFRSVFKREREVKPAAPAAESGSKMKLIISNPESFEEAAEIADNLRDKRAILMNIENAPRDVQRRLIDFLSGVAYALGGKIKRVSAQAYIITPTNVDVVGSAVDDFDSSGFYF